MIKYALLILLLITHAYASDWHHGATETTILKDVSDKEISLAVSTSMAAGSHQLDYSTTDWQGSVVGAFQISGGQRANMSFAIGKRFSGMESLFHATYTPMGSDDWVTIGGTWRF